MPTQGKRKRLFLFLISVILPSLLLVAFALRLISQDRELIQKRMDEERQAAALDIGRSLLSVLEDAGSQALRLTVTRESGRPRPAVERPLLWFAELRGTEIVLPWSDRPDSAFSAAGLKEPRFLIKLEHAGKVEFAEKSPARAAGLYEELLRSRLDPAQTALVRLSLARALGTGGRIDKARDIDRSLLSLPAELKDEFDIPFSVYAAERLASSRSDEGAILTALNPVTYPWLGLSPGAVIHGREVFRRLEDSTQPDVREAASRALASLVELARVQELAQSLKKDFPGLHVEGDPGYWLYGPDPWFVHASLPAPDKRIMAVCDARSALEKAATGASPGSRGAAIVGLQDPAGLPLGRVFPNARIALPAAAIDGGFFRPNSRTAVYLLIVALGLGIAVFGSYLFWRDMRRDLETAEMRSQFVASVSHELKTPLAAILMFAETLKLGRAGNAEKREEYLDTIVGESRRLDRLLANVLDLSKIEQGRRTYRFEKLSLDGVLETAVRAMDYPLRQKGFDLRLRLEPGIPELPADRDALVQAVLNLLDNAVKYSGEARTIDLILERDGEHAAIRVRDQGLGIAEAEQKRIFDKFYRVPDPRCDGVVGAGLGLSLAAHVAEAHRGRIDVQSKPGAGSVFSILLPLKGEE
jgi:signal transduction histidine kinase